MRGDYYIPNLVLPKMFMKNTDMLYWVGIINTIKEQAKEIVYNEIIYK